MRLLVVSSYWPRRDQIHNAFFEVEQVRALADLGHYVTVLFQDPPWILKNNYQTLSELALDRNRINLTRVVNPRLPEPFSKGGFGLLVNVHVAGARMKRFLAKEEAQLGKFDGIIVHGERNIGLSAAVWNRARRRPVAVVVHGSDPVLEKLPENFLQRFLHPRIMGGIDKVVLVGNRLHDYSKRVGYSAEHTVVVPNGFRMPDYLSQGAESYDGVLRLSSVARLIELKGIDDVLRALSLIDSEHPGFEWAYDIFGDGPDRGRLEKLCAHLGLSHRVTFHGSVSHQEVMEGLQRSSIFVLPSWNEAFGLVYLEAMAAGNAVVGCRANGAEDILEDGIDGCLVPPRDVKTLAGVLERLISNTSLRASLAVSARSKVKNFTWKSNAIAMTEILHDA